MSHFACIGLLDPQSRVPSLCDLAREDAPTLRGVQSLLWKDESGAAIAFHAEGDSVVCITPWFASPSPTFWRVDGAVPAIDEQCVHCSGADCNFVSDRRELVTRSCVQMLHFGASEAILSSGAPFDLEIVAFADVARFCTSEDFDAVRATMTSLNIAQESFLPMGMFGASPRSCALFAGTVEHVELRQHGAGFLHVRIRTLPGSIDVVMTPDHVARPGDLAIVEGWLVGRPRA